MVDMLVTLTVVAKVSVMEYYLVEMLVYRRVVQLVVSTAVVTVVRKAV